MNRRLLLPGLALTCVLPALPCIAQASPADWAPLTFTTDEGTWVSLDVAPDGRAIVFELLGDLYTLPVNGGAARPLITGPAFQAQPRYSRDGAFLAYVSDESGSDNVWVANADGTNARALTSRPRAMMTSPAWSPDGRTIYVTVIENRVAALWRVEVASGRAEPLVPNTSGPPSMLVSTPSPGPYGPHASADGEWLYYAAVTPRAYGVRQGAMSRIMRRHLATGRDEPVTLDLPVAMRPLLSPDGRTLAYDAQTQGRTGLRLRTLGAETERWLRVPIVRNQLEARASRDVLPGYAFTPDGKALIVSYDGKIHRLDVESGEDRVIPFTAEVSLKVTRAPQFPRKLDQGPVRARLVQQAAIARDGRVAFSALGRLWISTPAPAKGVASAPKRLTTTANPREFMPAWSPDGMWVAFVTWGTEGGHLWKVRSSGGAPVRLSEAPGLWADPVWTPDGARVVALRAPVMSGRTSPFPVPPDAQIVAVPAAGGALATIGPAGGARHPHFAADPQRVYLTAPDGLVSYALAGGGRTLHATFTKRPGLFGPQAAEARFSPDGAQAVLAVGDRLYRVAMPAATAATMPPSTPPMLDPDAAGAIELTRRAPLSFGFSPDGSVAWITGHTLQTLRREPAAQRHRATRAGGRGPASDASR